MRYNIMPILCLIAFLGGCASMPYNEDFECPQKEHGQCTSVKNAYDISLQTENMQASTPLSHTESNNPQDNTKVFDKAVSTYQDAVKKGRSKDIAKAKAELERLYAQSVEEGRQEEKLEMSIQEEDTRLGFLGTYALGQHAPGIRKPATLMEAYILPYQTEHGTLAGERTLWIPVEEATWVWPDKFDDNKGTSLGTVK